MKQVKYKKNRFFLPILLASLLLLLAACGNNEETTGKGKKDTIKIGYQKGGTTLLLKDKKELENELKEKGYKVEWSEFTHATAILEALNAGSIDFANAGDAPAIMALSKGMDFRYIASEPSAPDTQGILVHSDSGIESVKDLKGKRVAYNQASIAQYLLTKALEKDGLSIDEVESVYLAPPDASIAFNQGDVDAWVIWDPYLTVAEQAGNKILTTSEGITTYRSFYYSTKEMTDEYPDVVKAYVDHLNKLGKSINEDPTEAAALLEANTKVDADIWASSLGRKSSDPQYLDEAAIEDINNQMKDLEEIGLISKTVKIEDYVWQP